MAYKKNLYTLLPNRCLSYFLVVLFCALSPSLHAQTTLLNTPGPITYTNTDIMTTDVFGPVDISACATVSFSVNYNFSLPWVGSGNMESADECAIGPMPCAGDVNNPTAGACDTCWDFLNASFIVNGTQVGGDIIGDAGTTDAEQNGIITGTFCNSAGNTTAQITVNTQTWASNESVMFSNITIICNQTAPTASSPSPPTCAGGTISLQSTTPDPGQVASTLWTGPGGIISPGSMNTTVNNIPAGTSTYTVTTTDALGCSRSDDVMFTATPPPTPGPVMPINICYNLIPPSFTHNVNAVEASLTNGQPGVTVNWFSNSSGSPSSALTLNPPNAGSVSDLIAMGTSGNVFAQLDAGGGCTSTLIMVPYSLQTFPTANGPQTLTACGSGSASFNLTSLDGNILNGQPGTVSYFQDMNGITPVADPTNFLSSGGSVWAQVNGPAPNSCPSPALAQITLTVTPPMMPNISGVPPTVCSTDPPITLPTVQDGQAGNWTGPGVTANQFNPAAASIGPNTLTFTPTAAGCNIPANWTITVNNGPTAGPATPIEICYTLAPFSAMENIATVENTLTGGTPGLMVNWFTDAGATTPIVLSPFSPATATSLGPAGTLFAQVSNGTCSSAIVAVPYTNEENPGATTPPPMDVCGNPPQIFNLTTQDAAILNGQPGTVSYFLDNMGASPIPSPNIFSTSSPSTTVFAQVTGTGPLGCTSGFVPIALSITPPSPTPLSGVPPSICQSSPGVNLPVPQNGSINGNWSGTGVSANFFNPAAATPGSTVTLTFTPTPGQCAAPNSINILVEAAPAANPANGTACAMGGSGTFDLTSLNNTVNGGSGNAVSWFFDIAAVNPIPTPSNFVSGPTTVFATITNGNCTSAPVSVMLSLENPPNLSPSGAPNSFCAGETVNLNTLLNNPDGAAIQWFVGDPANNITSPATFPAASGGTYTAVGTIGNCTAQQAISITIAPSPMLALSGPLPPVCVGDNYDLNLVPVFDQNVTGNPITWHSANPPSPANQINPAIINSITGPTNVFAVAAQGSACENILPILINPIAPPVLSATLPAPVCSGNTINLGTISVTENGVPVLPTWHTALPPSPANQLPTLTVTPFGPTTYYAVQNLGGPCEAFVAVPVTVTAPPDLFLAEMPSICQGEAIDLSTLNVIDLNGSTPTLTWHTSSFPNLANQLPNTIVSPGNSINFYAVANLGGCEDILEVLVTVTQAPNLQFDDNVIICAGGEYDLSSTPITGANGSTISYHSNTPPTPANLIMNPLVSPGATTTFYAFAEAGDCGSEVAIPVIVQEQPDISLPAVIDTCSESTIILGDLINDIAGNDPVLTFYNDLPLSPANEITNDTILLVADSTFYVQAGISGCIDIDSTMFNISTLPDLTVSEDSFLVCSGTNFNLADAQVMDQSSLNATITYYSFSSAGFQQVFPGTTVTINQDSTFFAVAEGNNDCNDTLALYFETIPTPQFSTGPDSITSCGSYLLPPLTGTNLPNTAGYFTEAMGMGAQIPVGSIINTPTLLYLFADNGNSCVANDSVFINARPVPMVSLAIVDSIDCSDSTNGSISVSITGGTHPFNYDWNIDSLDGNDSPENLGPGLYELVVTDSIGCPAAAVNITLTAPAPIVLGCSESSPVSSVNGTDGAANINITGGTAPFSLNWEGPDMSMGSQSGLGNGDNTLTDLSAGNYALTITDDNGCTATCSFTITDPSCAMTVDISGENIDCFGTTTGSIILTVNNPDGMYTTDWNDDNYDGLDTLTALSPGTYEVTVTDGIGCSATTSFTINQPAAALQLSCAQENPVSTAGGMDGSASITFSGGTAPYAYVLQQSPAITDTVPAGTISIGNLEAGNYNLMVTDSLGCMSSCDFTIMDVSCALAVAENSTNIACEGDSTGMITLDISGAAGTTTIDWDIDAFDGQDTLNNLPAGTYSYVVTDTANCSQSGSIEIMEPATLSITCNLVNGVSAPGAGDGTIGLVISGGVGPYMLEWTIDGGMSMSAPATGDTTIMDLPGGLFTVNITDSNNCTNFCFFNIPEPACQLTLNPDVSSLVCIGDSTGTIDLGISGAAGSPTIDWNVDDLDNDDVLSNLTAGTYIVMVTDEANCMVTDTFVIDTFPGFDLSCMQTNPASGPAVADGGYSFTITGNTAPYDVIVIGPGIASFDQIAAGTQTVDNVLPGIYDILAVDANGCEAFCQVTVSTILCDDFMVMGTPTDVSCAGDSTGSIALTISGGIAPIDILWNTGDTTDTLNGLIAGDYSVTVSDANCVDSTIFTISEPDAIILTCMVVDSVSTVGGSDGSASVGFSGGVAPYELTVSNNPGIVLTQFQAGSISLPGLMAGEYQVFIEDANGCQDSCMFTITEPVCALDISGQATNPACADDVSGSILLDIQGAIGMTTIDWSVDSLDGLSTVNNLAAGTYTVTVTDEANCMAADTITLTAPLAISLSCAIDTEPGSPVAADGSASLTIANGSAPYTISWTGAATGSQMSMTAGMISINGLPGGTIDFLVTDTDGCTAECSLTFTPAGCDLELTLGAVNPTCGGEATGSISTMTTGGFGAISYDWSIDSLLNVTNPTGLPADTYTLLVTDTAGCTDMATVTLTAPPALTINCTVTGESSPNAPTGMADITIGGGVAPYDLVYAGPISGSLTDLDAGTVNLFNLPGGDYAISLTDANGCTTTCQFFIATQNCDLSTTISGVNPSCAGLADGSLSLNITGAVGDISLSWNPDGLGNQTNISNLAAGTYQVTVEDGNGCVAVDAVSLVAPAPIVLDVSTQDPGCLNPNGGSITLNAISGGNAPFVFALDGAAYTPVGTTPLNIPGQVAGNYTLTVQDVNGCEQSLPLVILPTPELALDLGDDITITPGDSVQFSPVFFFDESSWVWSTYETLSDSTLMPFAAPLNTTTYQLTVFDADGCSASDIVTIIVDGQLDVYFPNIFSPNADGINDDFRPFSGTQGTTVRQFIIYDRWGNNLHEAGPLNINDPLLGWDGNFNGQPMNTGVYVFYAEIEFPGGRVEGFEGSVLLKR